MLLVAIDFHSIFSYTVEVSGCRQLFGYQHSSEHHLLCSTEVRNSYRFGTTWGSINVTLDHKTSHKGQFWEIEIYTSSESWINKLSIDVWFVRTIFSWDTTIWKSGIWGCRCKKNLNIEKIVFKVVQMKFLAMHITNQKLSFDIFPLGHLQNVFMEHDLYLIS